MTSYSCQTADDLPINTERDYDADEARQRLLGHFGWNGDTPADVDGGSTRSAFLLFDADAPADRSSYKFPIAEVVNGRVTVVAAALRYAAGRLHEFDAPGPAKERAGRVLDRYFNRMWEDDQAPETRDAAGMLLSSGVLLDVRAIKRYEQPSDLPEELVSKIHDPSVLEKGMPFIDAAIASNKRVDSYYTQMQEDSLRNYASDADNGISLIDHHQTDGVARILGRTWQGKYSGGEDPRTRMDFYMPRGVDPVTDSTIEKIRWGTVNDVSIGFYLPAGAEVRCSVCNKRSMDDLFYLMFFGDDDGSEDVRDPDAPCCHIPGVEYPTRDTEGRKTGDKSMAIGRVHGAHVGELSLVFDGSTPGAGIVNGRMSLPMAKATRMLEMGVLSRRAARTLETRYRAAHFPSVSQRYYPAGTRVATPQTTEEHKPQESIMPPTPEELAAAATAEAQAAEEAARAANHDPKTGAPGGSSHPPVGTAPVSDPAPSEAEVRSGVLGHFRTALVQAGLAPDGFTGDPLQRVLEFGRTELPALRTQADVGTRARATLVEETRTELVRAHGAEYPKAVYDPILDSGSWDQLVATRDHAREQARRLYPGGRATVDVVKDRNANGSTSAPGAEDVTPISAFMAR